MAVVSIARLGIGYPIVVRPGEIVTVTQIRMKYWGSSQTVYICWGIKRRGLPGELVPFDNGAGLMSGAFASSPLALPAGNGMLTTYNINASLTIPASADIGLADTFVWISSEPSVNESKFIYDVIKKGGAISTDADILDIQISPALTLVYPAGGETILIGTQYRIGWLSQGISSIRIELDRGSHAYELIADNVPTNPNSYLWTVDGPETANASIRISDMSNPLAASISSQFNIQSPRLEVTSIGSITQHAAIVGQIYSINLVFTTNGIPGTIDVGVLATDQFTGKTQNLMYYRGLNVDSNPNQSWTLDTVMSLPIGNYTCELTIYNSITGAILATVGWFLDVFPAI